MNADQVLDGLDPQQREVAAHPLGPMVVLAGAGTGKTRAITHRIAYGVHSGAYQAPRVLAVTFTARAAGEMRTRLRGLGVPAVQARTFHAAALRQLHYFWPRAIGGAAPEVQAHKAGLVAEAAHRLRLQVDRVMIRDLAAEVEWAKVSMLTAESYPAAARRAGRSPSDLDPTAMARLIEAYEEVKAARNVIDFEDVLLITLGILREHPEVAREVRGQYRHFVVDEYQDVNALQQHLLDAWVGERTDLCVVGDPAQTIYSFTGASPQHLLTFARSHPDARQVELVRNYRSTPQVVALANAVLAAGSSRGVRLESQSAAGPQPELLTFPDDPAEAQSVAAAIRARIDAGAAAAQIAVLFRTNAQSEAIEGALTDHEVPYLVRGGERFFQRDEVRRAVVLLRGAARSDDGSVPLGDLVRDVVTGAGWAARPPTTGGAARERWESLEALIGLADEFAAAGEEVRLPHLVTELDRRAAEQHAPTVQGVTLASLHAAKGLEWDEVFLIGCSDGLLPISMATGPVEIEEERRLLYVGMTRARHRLTLSYSRARQPGGRATRKPSRFLDAAGALLGENARSAVPARRRERRETRIATCRTCGRTLGSPAERKIGRCVDCPSTYDEAQLEALKAWRLSVSRAAKVPAFVVFTDATLVAIAEKRPSEEGELRTVPGVGAAKLQRYAGGVLAVLEGCDPEEAAEMTTAATDPT